MDAMTLYKTELEQFAHERFGDKASRLVFGEGPIGAKLMLIGEAPGAQEEEQGRPFVGRAGKNLDEMLEVCGLNRAEIYIANAVKFRPTRKSAAGRTVNRTPTVAETEAFAPWLRREIRLVNPQIIATLGNTPLRALLGAGTVIGEVNGRLISTDDGLSLFPLYHPAALIYNPALRPVYRRDVEALAKLLADV